MKNHTFKLLVLFLLLFSMTSYSQIIGRESLSATGGNSLAFIDGSSNPGYNSAAANYAGKGILFPSMDLTVALGGAPFDNTSVGETNYNPNFYDGLVVYNTGTGAVTMGTSAADVAPGFYYYSNPGATTWTSGTWTPMGGGGSGGAAIATDTPVETGVTINGSPEKVVRLSGMADGMSTHIDLGTGVLAANAVSVFRKAIVYDSSTGNVVSVSTGDYNTTTNTFVTSAGLMNYLLPSGTYNVELYYE